MATKARFWAYVNSVTTGTTIRLRTALASEDHWGDTLDGTEAEWHSTDIYIEGDLAISGTGWKSWPVDIAHLELGTGTSRLRLSDIYEDDGNTRNVIFRSEEYTGSTYDPYLEIYEESDAGIQTLALLGVGG